MKRQQRASAKVFPHRQLFIYGLVRWLGRGGRHSRGPSSGRIPSREKKHHLAICRCLTRRREPTGAVGISSRWRHGVPAAAKSVKRWPSREEEETKEAFTYLPTCLEAFSKNFAFDATLQEKEEMFPLRVILQAEHGSGHSYYLDYT